MIDKAEQSEYPYTLDEVYNATLAAVQGEKGLKLKKEDRIAHRIEVATGVSATSWGDRVMIALTALDPVHTRVAVGSAPKTGAMLGGWMSGGHQAKNLSQIFEAISRQFEQTKTYKSQSDYEKDSAAMNSFGWQAEAQHVDGKKRVIVRWAKPRAAPPLQSEDVPARLKQLGDLKTAGLLTDEEYASKRAELLAKL